MCNIDTSNVVFVERVDEIICGVNIQFNSLKFDVEQNSAYEVAVYDCSVKVGLLIRYAYFSMKKIPIFYSVFWLNNKGITELLSFVFLNKEERNYI